MNDTEKHLQDIAEIKQMMARSSRFLSLSGWAGICSGLLALGGSFVAWKFLMDGDPATYELVLIVDAVVILVLALTASVYFSWRKARKSGATFWSPVTRRLIRTMLIPLSTGALLSLVFLLRDQFQMIAGITLIFYGLSLVSAGRFTNREAVMLGIGEIALGLAAIMWVQYGLHFWVIGFGLLHMVYGAILYLRYDRSPSL